MRKDQERCEESQRAGAAEKALIVLLCLLLTFPMDYIQAGRLPRPVMGSELPAPQEDKGLPADSAAYLNAEIVALRGDSISAGNAAELDSIPPTEVTADDYPYGLDGKIPFNPSPQRAVWLSALCPGLGQIYNRRYWKLPIVVGGFMGLGYATNWNNTQYQDYMQGYRDLLDNDPSTNSYMNFFPPNADESALDKTWVTQTFKTRKDYFRRNRDLCIISLVALYLICMVDAYVDASMAHFDISPNLAVDWSPTMMQSPGGKGSPAFGLNWALTF